MAYKDLDGDARKNQDEAIEDILLRRGYGIEVSKVLTTLPIIGIERDHNLTNGRTGQQLPTRQFSQRILCNSSVLLHNPLPCQLNSHVLFEDLQACLSLEVYAHVTIAVMLHLIAQVVETAKKTQDNKTLESEYGAVCGRKLLLDLLTHVVRD